MLHYNLITDSKTAEKISEAIKKAKNWLEVKKILKENGINPNFLNRILSQLFRPLDTLPNKLAFALMKEFKKKHRTFDLGQDAHGKEKYIKLTKSKSTIADQITALKKIQNCSEGWVTFKFAKNESSYNKGFDVFIGHAYRINGNLIWNYSSITKDESDQIVTFGEYNNLLPDTAKKKGIAFKVFPLAEDKQKDSIETWLKGVGDNVSIYPGYSTYTTLVLSNDSALDTKVDTNNTAVLAELSFDYGQACCPPQ